MVRNTLYWFFVIVVGFALLGSLTSCKKNEGLYEGPYGYAEDSTQIDTIAWNADYTNGGILPTGSGSANDDLMGTQWVLVKYVSDFATEYPNDTLTFTSKTKYNINGSAERNYQLAGITSSTNKELSFYYFFPFGGSHYSAQVGEYFVDDGELNNLEFTDIQNSSTTIRAWFEKIN
jgi:hypothetical protein